VPIYEVGELDGRPYFTMPFITGGSLRDWLRDGLPSPKAAAHLVQKVAEAVHYAHLKGIIHRDLKPHNILLHRDDALSGASDAGSKTANGGPAALSGSDLPTPRLTDFGLARAVEAEEGLTVSGQVMGTPSYMPPEQASGQLKLIGVRSDVYGLGAVFYFLLTGRPPFQSASPHETVRQVREQAPIAPRRLNPDVPRDLETVCLKCLAKEPSRRYATAAELATELGRFLAGQPVLARPVGALERAWRWCKRNPTVASLTAAVVLVLIAVLELPRFSR
jgi:serine/threonine protein kinase